MRATIIILFLSSFFCFGSVQIAHNSFGLTTSLNTATHNLQENQNDFVDQSNWRALITVDNEIVLLEESCSTDDAPQTFFKLKSVYFQKSYPSFPATIIIKDSCSGFKNFQIVYGHSLPIYISQGVLRI